MLSSATPNTIEIEASGILGILIYCSIISSSIKSFYETSKGLQSRLFFSLLAVMGLLELPRYIFMVLTEELYIAKVPYGLHILSGVFFCSSISTLCLMWVTLIQLDSNCSLLYNKLGIGFINTLNIISHLVMMGYCISYDGNSSEYFSSTFYLQSIIVEIISTIVVIIMFSSYSIAIISR